MVKVSFNFRKRDFVWFGLVVVLLSFGIVYAIDGTNPRVMGHTLGEIEFPGCDSDGQVLKYWGGEWICDDDIDTDTHAPATAATYISGGLYGHCTYSRGSRSVYAFKSPAKEAGGCGCESGYTPVCLGDSVGDAFVYYSCYKN